MWFIEKNELCMNYIIKYNNLINIIYSYGYMKV